MFGTGLRRFSTGLCTNGNRPLNFIQIGVFQKITIRINPKLRDKNFKIQDSAPGEGEKYFQDADICMGHTLTGKTRCIWTSRPVMHVRDPAQSAITSNFFGRTWDERKAVLPQINWIVSPWLSVYTLAYCPFRTSRINKLLKSQQFLSFELVISKSLKNKRVNKLTGWIYGIASKRKRCDNSTNM